MPVYTNSAYIFFYLLWITKIVSLIGFPFIEKRWEIKRKEVSCQQPQEDGSKVNFELEPIYTNGDLN